MAFFNIRSDYGQDCNREKSRIFKKSCIVPCEFIGVDAPEQEPDSGKRHIPVHCVGLRPEQIQPVMLRDRPAEYGQRPDFCPTRLRFAGFQLRPRFENLTPVHPCLFVCYPCPDFVWQLAVGSNVDVVHIFYCRPCPLTDGFDGIVWQFLVLNLVNCILNCINDCQVCNTWSFSVSLKSIVIAFCQLH
jgi:hypothetical protein